MRRSIPISSLCINYKATASTVKWYEGFLSLCALTCTCSRLHLEAAWSPRCNTDPRPPEVQGMLDTTCRSYTRGWLLSKEPHSERLWEARAAPGWIHVCLSSGERHPEPHSDILCINEQVLKESATCVLIRCVADRHVIKCQTRFCTIQRREVWVSHTSKPVSMAQHKDWTKLAWICPKINVAGCFFDRAGLAQSTCFQSSR